MNTKKMHDPPLSLRQHAKSTVSHAAMQMTIHDTIYGSKCTAPVSCSHAKGQADRVQELMVAFSHV